MPREEKKYILKEITGRLKKNQNIFITGFRGLKAIDMDSLREKLEEVASDYLIIKNTLAKGALKDVKLSELEQLIEGPTSFALVDDDPVKSAKVLVSFAKEHEGFNIRGGYVAGELLGEEEVKKLASLPSREILLAQVVGGICAPLSSLVFVLSGLLRGVVCALSQLQEKLASKEKEQPGQVQESQAQDTTTKEENVTSQGATSRNENKESFNKQ